jgi:hypothetical protein
MKAVAVVVTCPPKFVQAHEDRDPAKSGQTLAGYVTLDRPGRPRRIEIRWRDSRGRLMGRTSGRHEPYNRRVHFEFAVAESFFWQHRIECDIDGVRQDACASFTTSPATQGWETMPAITWATYPEGDFHDRLQEAGVNGEVAFKMRPTGAVAQHAMRFYVDNSTPDEIATYHRPHRLFWEPPADAKPPHVPWGLGYIHNWRSILDRYVRTRARARRDGVKMISRDDHYRKVLWRDFCPNAPGALAESRERLAGVVRLHKGFRPLFYNMADEAGITDQCKAFDYCYCPWCMDKFRQRLEQRYGTLSRLNSEWGTDFRSWDTVYPMTTDETLDAQIRGRPFNIASWNDHRAFMDDTFVEFFRRVRDEGKHWDSIGDFSQGGCQAPSAFGGWDYAKVIRHIDAIIPYNIGGNQEVIRSLRPGLKNLSPFFGDDPLHIRGLWCAYIHGDAGVVFWDADEKTGRFVTRPKGALSRRGRLFGPALREIRGGYARQFKAWTRVDDPIGLLYSQPSLRAHWLIEALDRRGTSEWFSRDGTDSRYTHVRLAWQRLIEDRQLQYRYASYLAVDDREEDFSSFRLLVLPETISVSEYLVSALRSFVSAGGVLVADGRCGRMTGNGRQVSSGLLDDLFGIAHGPALSLKPGAKLRALKGATWLPLGASVGALRSLDAEVRIPAGSGAEAAASAGKAPALIRRKVGKGWAVYLNADIHSYDWDRYDLSRPAPGVWREIADAIVRLAGISRAATVTERGLGTTAGIELTCFRQGQAGMAVAIANRTYRQSGIGEKLADDVLGSFETKRSLTLSFPEQAHTWNSRTGRYLGKTDSVTQAMEPLRPLIVSRLPYRVRGVRVDVPASVSAGDRVTVGLSLRADGDPVDHAMNVEVHAPDGCWCYWYSGVVVARSGRGDHTFTLALDDVPGRWLIRVRDTVTGAVAERPLRVKRTIQARPSLKLPVVL